MVTKLIGNALFGKEGFHVIHEIYSGLKPFRNSYTNQGGHKSTVKTGCIIAQCVVETAESLKIWGAGMQMGRQRL